MHAWMHAATVAARTDQRADVRVFVLAKKKVSSFFIKKSKTMTEERCWLVHAVSLAFFPSSFIPFLTSL